MLIILKSKITLDLSLYFCKPERFEEFASTEPIMYNEDEILPNQTVAGERNVKYTNTYIIFHLNQNLKQYVFIRNFENNRDFRWAQKMV